MKNFLSKRGFENPETLTNVYRFFKDILQSNFARACLISKNPFDNIDFVPIQNLSKKMLEDLKNNEDITYPKILSLFANENNLKHVNSLVAIENNENVVGWISGLLAPGNMILYRSFFVNEEHRKNALGLALLNEALKIHLTKFINLEGICAVSVDNHKVKKFVSIYFKNNFKHVKHEYEMTLNLNKN